MQFPQYFTSPIEITWEITHRCNLNCIHCYNDSGKKLNNIELKEKEKMHIAEQIIKLKIMGVCLSGGEPILCKSFWKLAAFLRGKLTLNTITNGFFINKYTAPKYAKMFNMIQVSIDGSNANIHDKIRGKTGSWKRAYNGINLLRDFGGKFSIATTVISHNVDDIGKIIDLAYKAGAIMWRGEIAVRSGRAAKNYKDIALSREQIVSLGKTLKKKKREYGPSLPIFFTFDSLALLGKALKKSPIPVWHCYISPSGNCGFLPFFDYPSISLKDYSLSEAWEKIKLLNKDPCFLKIISKLTDKNQIASVIFKGGGKNGRNVHSAT